MTNLKLQPDYDHTNVMVPIPYPYWINPENGDVGRQEFWKGSPKRLLGFAAEGDPYTVVLDLKAYAAEPRRSTGLYPVFLDSDGGIYTSMQKTRDPEA